MIPNIIHFVFGMARDFGGKPFSLVHYLSVKSAVELNKPTAVYFHYQYEPVGEWWQKAKVLVTPHQVNAPDFFMGRPVYHVAHKADIIRLQVLKETGGIYLDLDTICVKPFTDLLHNSFIMGEELKIPRKAKNWRQKIKNNVLRQLGLVKDHKVASAGLCNAILLSEKNSDFINLWLSEYKTFRSHGHDKYWNEHSVKVPEQIAKHYPEYITRLNPNAFFQPLYDKTGLEMLFEKVVEYPHAYIHHLWESFSWNLYLTNLSEAEIKTHNTTYNLIARKFI